MIIVLTGLVYLAARGVSLLGVTGQIVNERLHEIGVEFYESHDSLFLYYVRRV